VVKRELGRKPAVFWVCSADACGTLGDLEAHLGACASAGGAGPPAAVLMPLWVGPLETIQCPRG